MSAPNTPRRSKAQKRWDAWRDGLATKHEAALVKAFRDFARHLPDCYWGGWMDDTHDTCDCGLSAAIRACPPLRKAFEMKAAKK